MCRRNWRKFNGIPTQLCVRGTVYVLSAPAWGQGWTIVPYKLLLRCACGTPCGAHRGSRLHPTAHGNKNAGPSSVHEKKKYDHHGMSQVFSQDVLSSSKKEGVGSQPYCRSWGLFGGVQPGVVKTGKDIVNAPHGPHPHTVRGLKKRPKSFERYQNLVKRCYQHPLIKQNQNAARKLRSMVHTHCCGSPARVHEVLIQT